MFILNMGDDFDLGKLLNFVLAALGAVALVYFLVKIFRLDRFIPPEIPGFEQERERPEPLAAVKPVRTAPAIHGPAEQDPVAREGYFYSDFETANLIPNVPRIPEPATSHNKYSNKVPISEPAENVQPVKSAYEPSEVAQPADPVPIPMIKNTRNNESWSLQRDAEGNLIGISVDRNVKEYAEE